MTDKVQEIIIKIKNRISNYQEYIDSGYDDEEVIKQEELKDLLTSIDSMQEESVSEDLEEEISRCILDEDMNFDSCARHFANWQKEQMMAKAIDAKIGSFTNGTIYDADFNIDSNLKDDDKVKIIVIKED